MKKLITLLLCLTLLLVLVACNNDTGTDTTDNSSETTSNNSPNETTARPIDNCKHDNPSKIEIIPPVEPTCISTGLSQGMKCTLCDVMVVPQVILPIIDCIAGDWIIDKEATATKEGFKHLICAVCKETLKEEIIPAIGSAGLMYSVNSDGITCTITGIGTCTDTEMLIPSYINGFKVTGIGSNAFHGCSSLMSIDIPDIVTSIGNDAFYGCSSITSITIPDSITSISDYTFSGCASLTSITIPDRVTSIGNGAFNDCTSLTSITISDRVTSTGNGAFNDCTSLTSITIPDSVTSIDHNAFMGCTSLTSITIPDSVTSIGSSPFQLCTSLMSIEVGKNNEKYKSVDGNLYSKDGKTLIHYAVGKQEISFTIPDSVTVIDDCAFSGCTSIKNINIPDSVIIIGDLAFGNCTSLKNIIIPDSIVKIGNGAFVSCTNLTSITIPISVEIIGVYAFDLCTSLTNINFNGTKAQWNAISKASDWDSNTGNYTIYCSNGNIKK